MPLALSRDPGPTPSVGHVTGDMKRRESNETLKHGAFRLSWTHGCPSGLGCMPVIYVAINHEQGSYSSGDSSQSSSYY